MPTPGLLAGISSGSGSVRLGLSQKGDLPISGEPVGFCWSKVADARKAPIGRPRPDSAESSGAGPKRAS